MRRMLLPMFALVVTLLAPAGAFAEPYSSVYVLGDSLSDQGNLFQATLSVTGSGIPADDHYFQGRFSNGEIYAGFLAERLGVPLTASLLGGTNFAFGGTRANYNIVEDPPTPGGFPPGLFPWTLNLQRQAFSDQTISDPNALYIVFSGSNDVADLIGQTIVQGFEATKPISDQAVQAIRSVIQAFIVAGARDILVPNLPDLGIVPLVFSRDPLPGQPPGSTLVADTATALAFRFNSSLDEMLDEFVSVNIIRFDTFSLFRRISSNPAAFGLRNSTEPCYTGFVEPAGPTDTVCDDPESFVFWDAEHPTTTAHAVLAEQILRTITSDLLNDLAEAVAGLGLRHGIERALDAALGAAKRAHEDANGSNDVAAVGALRAFSRLVEAQRGRAIAEAEAVRLIERARQIMGLLGA